MFSSHWINNNNNYNNRVRLIRQSKLKYVVEYFQCEQHFETKTKNKCLITVIAPNRSIQYYFCRLNCCHKTLQYTEFILKLSSHEICRCIYSSQRNHVQIVYTICTHYFIFERLFLRINVEIEGQGQHNHCE